MRECYHGPHLNGNYIFARLPFQWILRLKTVKFELRKVGVIKEDVMILRNELFKIRMHIVTSCVNWK